jgi:DNA replication protein DnaC
VQAALAWRKARGSHRALVLALCGGCGTGKSVALGWAVLRHDGSARMISSDRAGSYDPSQAHSQSRAEWDRIVGVDLLAIDELGDEDRPDRVGVLLRARYNAGKATLLAGNLTPAQFRERYCDERLRSRLSRQQAERQRVTLALRGADMRAGGPR